MRLFDPDSGIMRVLGRIVDLAWLNVITLIFCLPIFTIGASLTALNYVTLRMKRGTEGYIFQNFWKSFKENFKQSTIIWLIMVAIVVLNVLGFNMTLRTGGTLNSIVAGVQIVGLAAVLLASLWVFPLQSKFYNPIAATITNALILGIRYFYKSLYMVIVILLPMVLLLLSWRWFPVVLLFGMSMPAYFGAYAYDKQFEMLENRVMEREQEQEEELQEKEQ